ncbi:MAG: response regulator transcription factor [Christensenellales bacterium]|jgi:two-component system response regulator YesN
MYRALIVEDENLMRDYLFANLTNFCAEWKAVAVACDGAEALDKLQKESFDGIITDIRMPVMNGLEMARILRERGENLPILILSGYDEFDYARTAVRLNISDYLLKPINEEDLSAALSLMATQVGTNRNDHKSNVFVQESAAIGLGQKAQEFIIAHYAEPISLTSVAEELGVTAAYLSTVFHREMGSTYSQTLLRIRMENAAKLLTTSRLKVWEIAQAVGFPSAKHFTYVFGKYFHCSPVEFRTKEMKISP